MARTLFDLADSLEQKAKAVAPANSKRAAQIALTIVGELAYKTPVDTSEALSNWIVTLDAPSNDKIFPYFPGLKGSTQHASAAQTIVEAKRVLAQKKPGQSIFITNNAPYIVRLNTTTHSKQQAPGFVERAIIVGIKAHAKNLKGL